MLATSIPMKRAEEMPHRMAGFENMQAIIDAIPTALFVKDRLHRIVLLNDGACALFGHSREALRGRSHIDLFPEEQIILFNAVDDRVFETGKESENEEEVTDAAGTVHHVVTRKRVARLDGADFLVATITDVSATRDAEARTLYLAFHDSLTGLPNRTLLKERIEQALLRRRHGCALLYVDLDHFKEVNDAHGHSVGDQLIQEFARRLSEIVRAADTVARLGGDEFAVLLSDTSQDPNADEVCRRVLIAAARSFELAGIEIRLGASVGVVLTGLDRIDQIELQRRADVALSQAKSECRGSFRIFTQALGDRVSDRQSLQADLREALETGTGLELHYQPLLDIASGQIVAFEALARWRHATRGLVMPGEFIPVAEASGLIVEFDEWVLTRACTDASAWHPPLRLSVNISPVQFAYGNLVEMVRRALEITGLDPARLDLEITEGVIIQDPAVALTTLQGIRDLGVKIVLDDFGVGYSSLSYFRQFPFDKIKIDRSFVSDMVDNSQARSIVEAVIALGRGLNLPVVAEGVETEKQLLLLTERGCDQAQGFLIGRPSPMTNFLNGCGTALNTEQQRIVG
jgi:diguanylate cyclase (GGDEF)-like protein/PAS domain S-box-containing protein